MAGGSSGTEGDDIITDINVTPLVDIILVILIIFMLTANLIDRQAIPVDLPEAATGEAIASTSLALTVTRAGTIYVNGAEVSQEELQQRLAQARRDDPAVQAIISADEEVAHGTVIALIDSVRQHGIHKFALNIEPIGLSEPVEAP